MVRIESDEYNGEVVRSATVRVGRNTTDKDYEITIHSIPKEEFEIMAKLLNKKIQVGEHGGRWIQVYKKVTIFCDGEGD